MSSKIVNSTLTIRISEEVELNNKKYGSKIIHTISNINEVAERILTVPTSGVTLLNLSSSAAMGTFITSDVKYARITNLDNTNYVTLTFASGSQNKFSVKLEPERDYVFTNSSISGSSTGQTFDSFSNFTDLTAKADTASVDIEVFVGCT